MSFWHTQPNIVKISAQPRIQAGLVFAYESFAPTLANKNWC